MSESWDAGSSRRWRRIRAQVLERDGHLCQLALDGCTVRATHAHHTHGRARTGDDPRYIVAACEHCNLAVGEPTPDPAPTPRTAW